MPTPDPAQLERMRRAIAALPDEIGGAYRLHLFDGLDYPAIASRLGLDAREVERRIAEAIVLIDRDLRSNESGGML